MVFGLAASTFKSSKLTACSIGLLMAGLTMALGAPEARAQAGGEVSGVWLTQAGDARVRVSKCGGGICGVVVWLRNPIDPATGRPATDDKNPNPALARRPMIGLPLFSGMRAFGPEPMVGTNLQCRRRQQLCQQHFGVGPGYAEGGRLRRRAVRRRDLEPIGALDLVSGISSWPGAVPAIYVFLAEIRPRRGCPAAQTSLRSLRKADYYGRA